jgi:hypothetical protein
MDKVAGELLGENVLAGATIASRGHISKMALAAGGAIGGAVGGAIAGAMQGARKPPTTPGGHRGLIYIAAGPSKLAFFAVKQGWLSNSIDKLLIAHPRADVVQMDVQGGMIPKINIVLADGTDYALECGMAFLGKVKRVQGALGK